MAERASQMKDAPNTIKLEDIYHEGYGHPGPKVVGPLLAANNSSSSKGTEVKEEDEQRNEEHTIHHATDELDDLSTLLNRLNLRHKATYCSMILQECEELWRCAPCDGGEQETQDSSATPSGSSSRVSSTSSNKRSRRELGDNNSEKKGLKKLKATGPRAVDVEPNFLLACPFYKVNPYMYSSCSQFKGGDISKTGNHLRKAHAGEYHCRSCYKSFENAQQETAHSQGTFCRSTRGPSVREIIPISKTKGKNGKERWYWIWEKLFPDMRAPNNPWWSEDVGREQIMLSALKRLRDRDDALSPSDWTQALLSEWRTFPPEHLPDLQQQMIPEADSDGSNEGPNPNNIQQSSSRAGPSIRVSSTPDPKSAENSNGENAEVYSPEACPQSRTSEHEGRGAAELPDDPSGSYRIVQSRETDDSSSIGRANMAAGSKGKAIDRGHAQRETTPSSNFDDTVKLPGRKTPDLATNTNNPFLGFWAWPNASGGESFYNFDDLDFSRDDAFEMLLQSEGIPQVNRSEEEVLGGDRQTNAWEGLDFDYGASGLDAYPFEAGAEDSVTPDHFNWWLRSLEQDSAMGGWPSQEFPPPNGQN
ncbi:hypothetical protein EKO27_g9029 [Xylaria grammica]|uniref:C2H2-type domain-containing protein n=1 Tax=Xylaria grammica TaxID=363999 RepID=A0A439CV88_9PEZI|nr:hypothetical protein EKO27_g9029 [Xylaria grammica]